MTRPAADAPWTDPAQLQALFAGRAALLQEHTALWAHRPFTDPRCPWEAEAPALAAWLRALPEAALDAAEPHPEALAGAPEPWAAWVRACQVEEPGRWSQPPPAPPLWDMSARKSAQVQGFVASLAPALPAAGRLVDWCSGHGHLGRALARAAGLELLCVERDPGLCATGEGLAAREGVRAEFLCADALGDAAAAGLGPGAVGVALHACGQLGDRLLERGAAAGATLLALAPCCYHRRPAEDPALRSAAGRACGLVLRADQARLATAEEVVASPRVRALRRQEQAWRQGLELLVQEATGRDTYLGFPSLRRRGELRDFRSFCEHLAPLKGVTLPPRVAWAQAEAAGWARARTARALGLPRALFRRPLEQLLVLDRALWLLERGRQAGLGRFCAREASPRDLLVVSGVG